MPFEKGQSGNPEGRPKNTGHRQRLFNNLVAPHQDDFINTAMEMALSGNEAMMRVFLDRLLPAKPKEDPLELNLAINDSDDIVDYSERLLRAASKGDVTVNDALSLSSLMENHQRIVTQNDLAARIIELEKNIESHYSS